MRENEYTKAIDALKNIPNQTEDVRKAIEILDKLVDRGTCPICGEFGCMNDHGYGGPGPEY